MWVGNGIQNVSSSFITAYEIYQLARNFVSNLRGGTVVMLILPGISYGDHLTFTDVDATKEIEGDGIDQLNQIQLD